MLQCFDKNKKNNRKLDGKKTVIKTYEHDYYFNRFVTFTLTLKR